MCKTTDPIGTKISKLGVPTKVNLLHKETFKSMPFCRNYRERKCSESTEITIDAFLQKLSKSK
jgi:hypothetical protein